MLVLRHLTASVSHHSDMQSKTPVTMTLYHCTDVWQDIRVQYVLNGVATASGKASRLIYVADLSV
jgi:hypothetical protein